MIQPEVKEEDWIVQQHILGMEEEDCNNWPTAQQFIFKTLAHLFIPKYLITPPV